MDAQSLDQRLEAMELELVTQRLVTRSLILYLLLSGDRSISSMIKGMNEASRRTSGEVLPLEGVDAEVHARASALAKKRGEQLVVSLGKLLAAEWAKEPADGSGNMPPLPRPTVIGHGVPKRN